MVAVTITANVLVTDVVESTTVLTRDGAAAAEAQRLRHDEVVDNVVEVFGGEVLKSTGDGALALLPSAGLLVRAGAAIAEAARSAGIALRIGAATGDVVRTDGDCFGEAVVVASRLCAGGADGQLLIAPSTVAIRGRHEDPRLQPLPARMLKGFDDPVAPSTLEEPEHPVEESGRDDIRLVGRADVLAAVHATWAVTPGRIVVLRGEPGIGKTFVAHALTADVDGEVIWVRFDPTASDGFTRWCSALDETTRRREIGPLAALGRECLSRAATHLPALAERFPIAVTSPDDDDRIAFFDALNDVVRSLRPPAVLVLDDLQWAGGTALALLQRLAATGAAPVRVLATCRAPLPDGLEEIDATVVDVGSLATPDLEQLVREEGFDDDVAADAAGRAGGNPFLALSSADAGSEAVAADAIAARFLRLDERVVAVLGVAALAGRRIDLPLLERASGTGEMDVGEAIDAAVDAGLLRADEHGGLVFVHDLVRETAARSVPAHRRLGLHAVIATSLDERGDVIGAAPHVLDGFAVLEPPRAVEQVFAACVRLFELGATEDALDVAQRLLGVLEHDPRAGPAQFARAHLAIGSVSGALGDIAADKHHAAMAGAAALQAGDRTMLAEAALARASYALAGQADPDTLALLDAALEQVPADDLAVIARLTAMRAFYLFNQEGDGTAARSSVAKATDMARAANDPVALAEVLTNSSAVGLARSEVREQRAILDELLALAPSLPYREAVSARTIAHRQGVVLSLQLGDRAGFDRHRTAAAEIPDRPESGLLRELGRMWDGLVCLLDGDPKGAIAIGAGLMTRQQRDRNLLASGAGQVFSGHRWRGTLDGVIDGVARQADQGSALPLTRSLGAVAVALVGDAARAGALLEPLLAAPDPLVDDSMLGAQCATLIEACTLTARPYPQLLEPTLQDFSGQLVVTAWGVEVVGAADRYLAILDARRGDVSRAAARFDTAAELERRLSSVLALRTQAWRHALLRDVPAPEVPAELAGIGVEVEALRRLTG